MRLEHEQMRALFRDMQASLPAHDARQFLGITETLLILMQQHNLKEEHVLYRLADQALGANGLALSAQFAQS
jgi:hemerythrin-like domain-containing protein